MCRINNEDLNRNLLLDAGEDLSPVVNQITLSFDPYAGAIIGVGAANTTLGNNAGLTPGNSAAGTVPATVTTDANGVGNFNLVYLKQHAAWITDEITASTQVSGTETTGQIEFDLVWLLSESQKCALPHSPFNNAAWPD